MATSVTLEAILYALSTVVHTKVDAAFVMLDIPEIAPMTWSVAIPMPRA